MMIKVSNEFLDFNELIEVEKQIKLFEEIATTDGDFSYAFELQKTLNNTRILQNPMPDNIAKPVYQKIPAKLLSDSGAETFDGYLRIERITNVYEVSFFAGNNNWFGMLSDSLQTLDWSEYDIDQTQSNIQQAIFNTEGIVFPLVDNGALLTRGFTQLKIEDFVAGIYVKTVFDKIFSRHGIKIQGELLNDVNYLSAITLTNGKSPEQIESRSSFVHTSFSARPLRNNIYKTVFDDETSFPYYDGSINNYDLPNSKYVADVKMVVKVDLNLTMSFSGGSMVSLMYFYVNGVSVLQKAQDSFDLTNQSINFSGFVALDAGDELEIYTQYVDLFAPANNDIVDGTVKITPTYLYKAFGNSIVPRWTQQQYVSNVFRLFNVLASYKESSQTLTLNLFEKIKSKTPVDLSEYISETEVDYTDFISSYGKKSLFTFKENDDEALRLSRQTYFIYESGKITVNNDFLNNSESVLESEFSNPLGYLNPVFDMSIELTNLIETEEDLDVDVTGVTDSLGQARFAITEDIFAIGDLVRVENSPNQAYNGDWVVETLGAGYVELAGVAFDTNATARIIKLNYVYVDSEDVYILHHVPLYSVPKFSGSPFIRLENTDLETMAIAFFNILSTGRQINRDFINSMSFSGESNPLHYQQTLIDQYFRLFSKVLNDPVKLFCVAHLPYSVFVDIDFLSPINIRTIESTNMYYLNRISGYKESYYSCMLELIKLNSGERTIEAVDPIIPPPDPEYPQILQADQVGISNGDVIDFALAPLTIGSKVLFVCCNVADGDTSMTCSETSGNVNMANSIDTNQRAMYEPLGSFARGKIYYEVIDITDVDSVFQFTFAHGDGNTHYSAGFAIEIAAGAEWDSSYLGLIDPASGYQDYFPFAIFTTGTVLSSVPNVVTPQVGNLFIPFGFSMGLSPGGNSFAAPFGGLNPSGSVNPAGVLMGMAWNAVEVATAGDQGPLVYNTSSGISGVRQWLSWGNFYIP